MTFTTDIYVYDDRKWFRHPALLGVIIGVTTSMVMPFVDYPLWLKILAGMFILSALVYSVFKQHIGMGAIITHSTITLRDQNTKLTMDLDTISDVWYEGQKLFVRRFKRVDSFDFTFSTPENFDRLIGILYNIDSIRSHSSQKVQQ